MDFKVKHDDIYDPKGHIIDELGFLLTIDKDDEDIVLVHSIGEYDNVVKHQLPRLNKLHTIMHVVAFTFSKHNLSEKVLPKKDQVTIVNYMRNHSVSSKTNAVAHAIKNQDMQALNHAFNDILALNHK